MDRVHYRRVTPSRLGNDHAHQPHRAHNSQPHNPPVGEEIGAIENLIMQSTVSGILLVVVLIISLVDIAPAIALRGSLRQVLEGAGSVQELVADVRRIGEEWMYLPATPPATYEPQAVPPNTPGAPSHATPAPGAGTDSPPSLEYLPMFEAPPLVPYLPLPTANYEPLNPQIPGPLAVPGLWD